MDIFYCGTPPVRMRFLPGGPNAVLHDRLTPQSPAGEPTSNPLYRSIQPTAAVTFTPSGVNHRP